MPSALLLKEARGQPADDPYHVALLAAGHTPTFVPVLDHVLVNSSQLRQLVQRGPAEHYAGLIITSQRAVEAWDVALRDVDAPLARPLTELPVFVVGPATAEALASTACPPRAVLGAASSGTGESLARFIGNHYASSPPPLPLLYLVGDKRRDVLPSILRDAGIALEELEVYRTDVRPSFEAELDVALDALQDVDDASIVAFSPSGAKTAIPVLQRRGLLGRLRMVAIGPTTRDYLVEEMGVRVDAMALSPAAHGLVHALGSVS
jgi:uroporphyrinogen-III synthase